VACLLASVHNQKFLRWSGSCKDDFGLADPLSQESPFLWIKIIKVIFIGMLLSKKITMNDNSSALFPCLLVRKTFFKKSEVL
jgi:hypothetical protein